MTPFTVEQARFFSDAVADAASAGAARMAMEVISLVASAYFRVRPATDSEAMHLVDVIFAALGEADGADKKADGSA